MSEADGEADTGQIVELRDGSRALIRPIRPEDKWRLQEGLAQLSPHSRFLRFHAPVERLTAAQLRYLTELDGRNHVAWVALLPDAPEEPGMGVARYARLADEPDVAEAAITVLDRYQGRGLGSAFLALIVRSATANGIRTLRNYVLAENDTMLDIFEALGATRVSEGRGVYRVDMDLPRDPVELPTSAPHKVLRASARGRVPVRLPVPSWWPRGRPGAEAADSDGAQ